MFSLSRDLKIVRYIESSLNRGFLKSREFIKKLLVRIEGTRHLVRYTGKFVIQGFNCNLKWYELFNVKYSKNVKFHSGSRGPHGPDLPSPHGRHSSFLSCL